MNIKDIKPRYILDSRGNPTVEADVILESGVVGRASVPSGASCGVNEAIELRDGGSEFHGKGVLRAMKHIRDEIRPQLIGMDASMQKEIDRIMIDLDKTENKSKLGANAILAASFACAHAAALEKRAMLFEHIRSLFDDSNIKLPRPMVNVINGGVHAANGLDIQEFMICPAQDMDFHNCIRMLCEVFYSLKNILRDKGFSTNVGDEGGFAPDFRNSYEALDAISEAVTKAGYRLREDICIALDAAATIFFKDEKYYVDNQYITNEELVSYYSNLVRQYPIISIEDPISETDTNGWSMMMKELGNEIMIVGDDLFCTNPSLFNKYMNLANAVLIKPNQIGTLTETLEMIRLAREHKHETIISHRSGETEDVTIAHLAVGTGANFIKTGSMSRTDRIAKYNELLRIHECL